MFYKIIYIPIILSTSHKNNVDKTTETKEACLEVALYKFIWIGREFHGFTTIFFSNYK